MPDLVNISGLAKILGVSRVTIHKAIKDGFLVPTQVEKSGPKFDPETAKREWAVRGTYGKMQSHHRQGSNRGGRTKANDSITEDGGNTLNTACAELKEMKSAESLLVKAKSIRERIKAEREHLDLQRRKGELIEVETVRKQGAELGSIIIGNLSAIPTRLADQLAVMTDPHEIFLLLDDEMDAVIISIRKHLGLAEQEGETPQGAAGGNGGG